jgi:hypothetical protein
MLVEMPHEELHAFIRQLGVYQLAELSYRQPRRSLVRLRQRLLPEDRDWFDLCVFGGEHLEDDERGRLRKLFSAVSNQGTDMPTYLAHIGLYSIAVATSARFAHKLRRILGQLPDATANSLRIYNQRAAGAPLVLSGQLRVTMDEFVARRRAYLGERFEQENGPPPFAQQGVTPENQEQL